MDWKIEEGKPTVFFLAFTKKNIIFDEMCVSAVFELMNTCNYVLLLRKVDDAVNKYKQCK